MHLSAEWRNGKYPTFNLNLATKEGKEPFLVIKGCKIVDGQKGEFISWPAKKMDDGKWLNHVYASREFVDAALKVAKEAKVAGPIEDMTNDVPF